MTTARMRHLYRFMHTTSARKVVVLDECHDSIPFDRIKCTDLKSIGEAWLAMPRVGEAILPDWATFKPTDFTRCLSKICVLRIDDGCRDEMEFSLYGGHPTEFLGNGKPLVMQEMRNDPLRSSNYIDIRKRTERAIDNLAPQYSRKTLSWNDKTYIEYETLILPFAAHNGVQRVLQPVSARARLRLVHAERQRKWCEIAG